MKTTQFHIVFFLCLVGLTLATVAWITPYLPVTPPRAVGQEGWRQYGPAKGSVQLTGDTISIQSHSPERATGAWKTIDLVPGAERWQIKAQARCENVVPGPRPWYVAKLMLVQYNGKKPMYHLRNAAVTLKGTREWQDVSAVFSIHSKTDGLRVAVELLKCTGAMEVRNLTVYPVRSNPVFGWIQKAMLVGWGLFFLHFLWMMSSLTQHWGRVLSLIFLFAIAAGVSMPSHFKSVISMWMAEQLRFFGLLEGQMGAGRLMGKWGHFILFTLLGCFWGATARVPRLYQFLFLVMLAVGTESVQVFIQGRNPLIKDVFIDLSGGCLGLALAWWVILLHWGPGIRQKDPSVE